MGRYRKQGPPVKKGNPPPNIVNSGNFSGCNLGPQGELTQGTPVQTLNSEGAPPPQPRSYGQDESVSLKHSENPRTPSPQHRSRTQDGINSNDNPKNDNGQTVSDPLEINVNAEAYDSNDENMLQDLRESDWIELMRDQFSHMAYADQIHLPTGTTAEKKLLEKAEEFYEQKVPFFFGTSFVIDFSDLKTLNYFTEQQQAELRKLVPSLQPQDQDNKLELLFDALNGFGNTRHLQAYIQDPTADRRIKELVSLLTILDDLENVRDWGGMESKLSEEKYNTLDPILQSAIVYACYKWGGLEAADRLRRQSDIPEGHYVMNFILEVLDLMFLSRNQMMVR